MTRHATDAETSGPESESANADSHAALVARICWHYYKEGQTQDVIAQHLKITRKRVNQILGEARESGVVQITIASPTWTPAILVKAARVPCRKPLAITSVTTGPGSSASAMQAATNAK